MSLTPFWTLARAVALTICFSLVACGGGHHKPPDADADGIADASDCAPNDGTRWQMLSFAAVDDDADGHPVNTAGQVCSGATLPAHRLAAAVPAADADCNDADASRWTLLAFQSRDADGDAVSIAASGQVCSGTALPPGYGANAPQGPQDCDDANQAVWRRMTVYRDRDGDGVGSGTGALQCIGKTPAAPYVFGGYDPLDDPADPNSAAVNDFDLPSYLLTVSPSDD